MLLPSDKRRAALLTALEEYNDYCPGVLLPGKALEALYAHLTDGDALHEPDLQYLAEKKLIEFFRRDKTPIEIIYTSSGMWIDVRTGQKPDKDDPRFRLKSSEEHGLTLDETIAVRILAAGQDWLDDRRQTQAQQAQGTYEIFISGCQDELETERLAAREAVEEQEELRSRFKAVAFEQDLSPSSRSPQAETEEAARRCDIYLGLFGIRYGTQGSDRLSPTEREYRAAVANTRGRLNRHKDFWIFRSARQKGQEEPLLKQLELCSNVVDG